MPKQYYNGEPIGYRILYYPVDLESDFKFVSVNYTINTTSLTKLYVYTKYAINVSAVSSGGVGPAVMAITRTNAEGDGILKNSVILKNAVLFQRCDYNN